MPFISLQSKQKINQYCNYQNCYIKKQHSHALVCDLIKGLPNIGVCVCVCVYTTAFLLFKTAAIFDIIITLMPAPSRKLTWKKYLALTNKVYRATSVFCTRTSRPYFWRNSPRFSGQITHLNTPATRDSLTITIVSSEALTLTSWPTRHPYPHTINNPH